MTFYDLIIIGGGASGLMAGYAAAKEGLSVCILEKMPRPARKVMLTGKGRCNFTNARKWEDFQHHIHPKSKFFRPAFYQFPPEKLMDLFARHGLESVVERGQRVFPLSHQAADVVDTLEKMCRNAGAQLFCHKEVKGIVRSEQEDFILGCHDGSSYKCKQLMIATGGLSYPSSGSSGDGYEFAQKWGHRIQPTFPSLTALVPVNYKQGNGKGHIDRSTPLSEMGGKLCGISLKNIALSLYIDGSLAESDMGDLDFTDGGIEGPLGFRVSRKAVKALINGSKVVLEIDLKPGVEEDKLAQKAADIHKMLPAHIAKAFEASSHKENGSLAQRLKHWRFPIAGYVGYERSVVTAGGVSLDEINPKTFESKQIKGLYIIGELLDLDADTGGYNLHIAFASGWVAGHSAATNLPQE